MIAPNPPKVLKMSTVRHYKVDLEIATEQEYKQEAQAYLKLGDSFRPNEIANQCYEKALKIASIKGFKLEEAQAILGLAENCRSNNMNKNATEHYKRALYIAEKHKYPLLEAQANLGLGGCCRSNNVNENATKHYRRALDIAIEYDYPLLETQAYFGLGEAYRSNSEKQRATPYYEIGLKIAQREGYKLQETQIYLSLGETCRSDNPNEAAIHYHKKAFEIAREQGYKPQETQACFVLGEIYRSNSENSTAIGWYENVLQVAREQGNKLLETQAYICIGKAHKSSNQNQLAIDFYKKGLEIAKEERYELQETQVHLWLGEAYTSDNQNQTAIHHYRKALEIARDKECKPQKQEVYLGFGEAYTSENNFQTSTESWKNLAEKANEKLSEFAEQLVISARSYQAKGQYKEAIEKYEQAAKIANETDQEDIQATAYQHLGNVFAGSSEYKQAIQYYQKAREIFVNFEANEIELTAYQWLGYNHLKAGHHEESIDYYSEAAKLASQLGCKTREVNANIGIGSAHSNIGSFNPAEQHFLKAISLAESLNNKCLERDAHMHLGHVYLQNSKLNEAVKSYLQVEKFSHDLGDKKQETSACLMLANAFQQVKQYENAIESYKKALNISEELGDKEAQTQAVHGLGSISFNNNEYEKALAYTKILVELTDDDPNNNGREQALAQKRLGMCYAHLERFEEALTCFQKALDMVSDHPENALIGILNEWCGYCCLSMEGKHQEGIKFYEQAIEIAKQYGEKYQEYRSNQAIANILTIAGSYDKAKQYCEEAVKTAMELGDKYCEAKSRLILASNYMKDCDYEMAKKEYENALDILGAESNHDLLREKALTGLGVAFFNLGDTEMAVESIEKAKTFVKKETNTELHNALETLENQSSEEETTLPSHTPDAKDDKTSATITSFKESEPEFKVEQIDELIEEASNPRRKERLPNDDLVRLEKCIKQFSASYVYTHRASSKDPFSEKVRKSMTRNVKSLAYKNLLGRNIGKDERNTGKFVDNDQLILNLARDELKKNKSTSKPAIFCRRLSSFIKSIGQISCGTISGTCWIVSGTLVITCYHVYNSFMEERNQCPNSTLPIVVAFDYFYTQRPELIHTIEVDEERDPQIDDSHLDYKFLRLRENEALEDRDGLGQFVRNRSLQEGLVTIVGHPGGNLMHEETCVVVTNFSWRMRLQQRHISTGLHMTNDHLLQANQYQEQGCLPYDTTLFSGSSGSPVFDVNGNIVAMHTQGYTLDIDERRKCSLMEFGVQFSAIYEDLRRHNFNPEDLFPDYNLGPNEERMDEENNQ